MEKEIENLPLRSIKVVAGILVLQKSNGKIQILAQKRPKEKEFEAEWEFAGGKLEKDETPEQALVRELKEELDIDVINWKFWTSLSHFYKAKNLQVEILFYFVPKFSGNPTAKEDQTLLWLQLPDQEEDLKKLPFLEADRHIVSLLPSYDYTQLDL